MRMLDYLLQDPRYSKAFDTLLIKQKIPSIICDEAAKLFYQDAQDEWFIRDFEGIAPPFNRFWLDFQGPDYMIVNNKKEDWDALAPSHWGFDVTALDATRENIELSVRHLPSLFGIYRDQLLQWLEGSRWFVDFYLYMRVDKFIMGPTWYWRLFLDADGNPILTKNSSTRCISNPISYDTIYDLARLQGLSYDAAFQDLEEDSNVFLHTALMSLQLMNCKNITLEDAPIKKKPLTNAQRRRGEKEFFVKHKILNIQPFKNVIRKRREESEQTGEQMPLHWVKACYKTYTEEKKLFGKVAGKFYIPAHWSGSVEIGEINKKYYIDTRGK